MQLFPFQHEAVSAVEREWDLGCRHLLVSLPTGGGKTIVGLEVARRYAARTGEKVLFLVHRDELLQQTLEKTHMVWEEVEVGVVQRGQREYDRPLIVASVQTLVRHLETLPRIGLAITDEAHHAEAPIWQRVYKTLGTNNPDFLHLGLTATPFRMQGKEEKSLLGVFKRLAYGRSMFELIVQGFLAHIRGVCISTEESLDHVKTRGGDFEEEALARAVNTPARNRLVVKSYLERCPGKKAVCFAVNVDHARVLTKEFGRAKVTAELLTGETPLDERRAILKRLREGKTKVVANCSVLTEGFDEPSMEAVICARPTKSRVLYIQMVGRASRLWPGKTEGIVLDFVDATQRHRPVSMAELLTFYGLREAEVKMTEVQDEKGEKKKQREFHLTPQTIPNILSIADLSSTVREMDIFRLDAFAWHQAKDGSGHFVSMYDGASLGVVSTGQDDLYQVVVAFRAGAWAELTPSPVSLQHAMGCANAYLFDFGEWRLASREVGWRSSEPTQGQISYLLRALKWRREEVERIVGFVRGIRTRGEASGAITALEALRIMGEGKKEERERVLERLRERYSSTVQEPGSSLSPGKTLEIGGDQKAPARGALQRLYQQELLGAKQGTFQNFVRQTLEVSVLYAEGSHLIIGAGPSTAHYTRAQWEAVRQMVARELRLRVGTVEVTVQPGLSLPTHAQHPPANRSGL